MLYDPWVMGKKSLKGVRRTDTVCKASYGVPNSSASLAAICIKGFSSLFGWVIFGLMGVVRVRVEIVDLCVTVTA